MNYYYENKKELETHLKEYLFKVGDKCYIYFREKSKLYSKKEGYEATGYIKKYNAVYVKDDNRTTRIFKFNDIDFVKYSEIRNRRINDILK